MISLNRKQIGKLNTLMEHFKEVEWFTVEEDSSNGLGPAMQVRFNLFGDTDKDVDATVDITDVDTW